MSISDYKGKNRYFINPYNFVNLNYNSSPVRNNAVIHKGGRTGVIHCELITKTELSIPDVAESDLSKPHKEYGFMRTPNGIPMIPGSSLRGTIRSVFETITNSCMSTTDSRQMITFRTKKPFKPGLVYVDENGNYHLCKAKRYIFRVKGVNYLDCEQAPAECYCSDESVIRNKRYGEKCYILPLRDKEGNEQEYETSKGIKTKSVFIKEKKDIKAPGFLEGWLCIGEPFAKSKHFESVFVCGDEVCIDEDSWQKTLKQSVTDLNNIIKVYNDDTVNKNAADGKKFYNNRDYTCIEKEEKYYPVWYKIHEDKSPKVYLSVANIGRAAYNKTMGNLVGNYAPCTKRENLCPACNLFGMVGNESVGSSIRFSDAIMNNDAVKGTMTVLKELSSPKPSYLPFYLMNKLQKNDKDISYDNDAYVIRGRKYYWHNTKKDFCKAQGDIEKAKTKRNASVELIPKESKFVFDVYYNNIGDDELNNLIWVLTLGVNDENGEQCHKIGHGKPIGLGSVKIVVKSVEERDFKGGEYTIKCIDLCTVYEPKNVDREAVKQVKFITNLKACDFPVDYPGVVNSNGNKYINPDIKRAAHQWFKNNYQLGKSPKKMLPEILSIKDKNMALCWKTLDEAPICPICKKNK